MDSMVLVVVVLVASVASLAVGLFIAKKRFQGEAPPAQVDTEAILGEARKQAEILKKEALLKAKEEVFADRDRIEKELEERKGELAKMDSRLLQREGNLDKKEENIDKREARMEQRESQLEQRDKELDSLRGDLQQKTGEVTRTLERVANMSAEEAKQELRNQLLSEARHESAKELRELEEETKKTADRKAKEIISLAMQRYAGEYVAERTVTSVQLPGEEMKGRIIGREGRNIRALEAATGIDLIVDDTPEAVILSGYQPRAPGGGPGSLERLIADGRIHPARIEEVVKKATKEMDQEIREAGEQATFDVGVHGIHPEIVNLVGRLKFRTSYAQNVLTHSLEVAFLCGIMAAELG